MRTNFMIDSYIKLAFFTTLLVLGYCSPKDEISTKDYENHLVLIKSVSLPLDEKSTYEFFKFQVVHDTLIVLNHVNNSIDFYNLRHGKYLNRIKIPTEGEYGIPKLYSFLYHNADSIFVFSQFRINNIKLFDRSGAYISTIRTELSDLPNYGIINHAGLPSMPSYFFDGSLYFQIMPSFDSEMTDPQFINEIKLDLKTGKLNPLFYSTKPEYLHDTPKITYGLNRLRIKQHESLYSWKYADTVYFFSDNGYSIENTTPLFFGSNDIIRIPSNKFMTDEEIAKFEIESYSYGKLLYDEQSRLVHRVKYLPLKEHNGKNPYLERDFEIITVNLEGKFIGKTYFNAGTYDPRVLFFGSEGIYLPKINPNYHQINEDLITYDIFKTIE